MAIPIPRLRIPKPRHRDPIELYDNLVKRNNELDKKEQMLRREKNPDAGVVGLEIAANNERIEAIRKKLGRELLRRESANMLSAEAREFWS